MLTVIESPEFIACAAKVWGDDERHAFVDWISENPEAGDVIANSGSLRKVRWSRAGSGKSGGVRVIYFVRNDLGELVLLFMYAKSKMDSLKASTLKELRDAVK